LSIAIGTFDCNFGRLLKKHSMPRSVNSVAKEQEEKIMKQAKGFLW
jgi:hypothetical protein